MAEPKQEDRDSRVVVLGIGRGGSRVADTIAARFAYEQMTVVAADTDAADLKSLDIGQRLQLGREWTYDEGCGGDVVLAERAAGASSDEIKVLIRGARLLLVVVGLGGGTGSGAAKVVARLAQAEGIPALFIAMLPFAFEGNWRRREADKALALLRDYTPAVMAIPNDMLFGKLSPNTPAPAAFTMADELLAEATAGLARMASADGLITVDVAAIKRLLHDGAASSTLSVGKGEGTEAAAEAVQSFIDSPFIGTQKRLEEVDAALITLLGGDDLSMGTIQRCLDDLQDRFPEGVRLVVGAYIDPRMHGRIQLTGLLCRYPEEASLPPEVEQPGMPVESEGAAEEPPRTRTRRKRAKEADVDAKQGLLPLLEQSAGIFTGTQATTLNGQNLDVPTFQRKGLRLDIGD